MIAAAVRTVAPTVAWARSTMSRLASPPVRPMSATGPLGLSAREWLAVVIRSVRHAGRHDYGMAAGAIAFSGFLSLLPLLAMVALAYGRFAEPDTVLRHTRSLLAVLPGGSRRLVGEWLADALTRFEGRGWTITASALVTLYGATRAGRSIIAGLNLAADVTVRRSFLTRRLLALTIVVGVGALMVAALFALSALAFVDRHAPAPLRDAAATLSLLFWPALSAGAVAALALIYRFGPARPPPPWRWVLPGAFAATVGWAAATLGFGWYLRHFGARGELYGSIGAVVVLQFWLYLSAFILLLGARLNVEAQARSGAPKP